MASKLIPSNKNKRTTLVWIVNIALLVLVVLISMAGYQAYQRLNSMVSQLEKSAEPNYNLLLIKELSFFINEMERETELYASNSHKSHLREFNEAFEQSQYMIDSLQNLYEDEKLKALCDSLSILVKERAKVQTQQSAISNDLLENTIEDLSKRIEELPESLEDTTQVEPPKKPGLFKRIFTSKKKRAAQQDTINRPSQVELLQKEIMSELKDTQIKAGQEGQKLKSRLSGLEEKSQELQEKIIGVINALEVAELDGNRDNVKRIQALARDTNGQTVLFSFLASALLIITIISQLNYLIRNRKHQLALQEAKARAEELTKAKEQFLANMSHEIRTPMNAIMGFTNQLMKSELGQKQEEQVKIIKTSADHLLHVLNDVLDFSKLQSGKVALEQEPFSPKELFQDCTRLFEDMAAEKGLKLITELPVLPKQLKGDVYRIRQILLNLLSNAIKFTEKGQVKLSVELKANEAGITWLQIIVEDSGVGIPKKHQARIFEEFEQVRTGDSARGTGLGLAISSMLTKLHGGNIRVKSLPGHGTSMILDLPFGQVTAGQTETHKADKTSLTLSDLRILIADDEPFNLKLLQAIFQNHAVDVFEKTNGKEALELLLNEPFDIALLDLKMPGMNGWEVAEQVRQQYGPNQKTAMIALTATVSEVEKQKSIDAGFNRILRKPFEEARLIRLIARLTKTKKSEKLTKGQEKKNEKAATLKIDFSSLSKMGDEAFVREMIEVFLKSSKEGVDKLQTGLEKEDRAAIRNEVHKMLPPSRHLKITALVEVLEKLHSSALTATLAGLKEEITKVELMIRHINDQSTDQ